MENHQELPVLTDTVYGRFVRPYVLWPVAFATAVLLILNAAACQPTDSQQRDPTTEPDTELPRFAYSTKVEDAVWGACSTAILRGLSEQLIAEIECLEPGTMTSIASHPNVVLGDAVLPYLQTPAAEALEDAAQSGTIYVTSALRSLAQQYLLYRWYLAGRCGIPLAASPGRSNHESGLAVDVSNYSSMRTALANQGFSWHGSNDPVHFDYYGAGTVTLRGLSVLAFQRLWNRNHPDDLIDEDGAYGTQTAARLAMSPVNGFSVGPTCNAPTPQPTPAQLPMEVYWSREADGSYKLHALAAQEVVRVEYYVDDYGIGSASRSDGNNFPARYTFNVARFERQFEVRGFDAGGQQIGTGVGLIDVTDQTAVYIRQMGANLYEIGLERAPGDVGFVEVEMDDQWLLTDAVTGDARTDRLAVRYTFSALGERSFAIRTYNADGSWRGTLRRTFTLR